VWGGKKNERQSPTARGAKKRNEWNGDLKPAKEGGGDTQKLTGGGSDFKNVETEGGPGYLKEKEGVGQKHRGSRDRKNDIKEGSQKEDHIGGRGFGVCGKKMIGLGGGASKQRKHLNRLIN